jgi:dehydrogenase/reductase SDR family protein 7B
MNYFQNKCIVITGASSGIGSNLAIQMAAPSIHLILIARNEKQLQKTVEICRGLGSKVDTIFSDLTKKEDLENACQKIGELTQCVDVLINNAGVSQRAKAFETIESVNRYIMEINYFAPVIFTQKIWHLIEKSKEAQIINISSVAGLVGVPLRSVYAASKHALKAFFEVWSLENRKPNIHFTLVFPGRINTPISYNALTNDGSQQGVHDEGQKKGISVEVCCKEIINAIKKKRRTVYIMRKEWILLFVYKHFPSMFVFLIKKLDIK